MSEESASPIPLAASHRTAEYTLVLQVGIQRWQICWRYPYLVGIDWSAREKTPRRTPRTCSIHAEPISAKE